MVVASFYAGPETSRRYKRYNGQQEIAPNKKIRLVVQRDGFGIYTNRIKTILLFKLDSKSSLKRFQHFQMAIPKLGQLLHKPLCRWQR
jgi:hypothetical protein